MSDIIYLSIAGGGLVLLLLSFLFDLDFLDMDGFSFSLATMSAGVTAFGVFGFLAGLMSAPPLFLGSVAGIVTLVLGGFLLAIVKKKTGPKDARNVRGSLGTVTSVISHDAPGTVELSSQSEMGERVAYTNDKEAIPSGSQIIVTQDSGSTVTVTLAS